MHTPLIILLLGALVALPATGPGVPGPADGGKGKGGGGGGAPSPEAAIVYSDVTSIWLVEEDGEHPARILDGGAGSSIGMPRWSPDNSEIVFSGQLGGVRGIFILGAGGDNLRTLLVTPPASSATMPSVSWSPAPQPDGQHKIAFWDLDYGDRHIFVINPDGSDLQDLTLTAGITGDSPEWSADGNVLFVREWLPSGALGVVGHRLAMVAGQLVVVDSFACDPGGGVWSLRAANTGARIGFSTFPPSGSRWDIAALDLSDPALPLHWVTTTSDRDEQFGAFSPDDSRVVFVRRGRRGAGIYTADVASGAEIQITSQGAHPDWKRPAP